MTNADKIRQMTDEELLEWVAGLSNACMDYDIERCGDYKTCRECWSYWMKQEAKRKKT